MKIRGVFIEDTFAEAFGMRAARLVITARDDPKWAVTAALKLTGFATSVIALQVRGGHRTRARRRRRRRTAVLA